MPDPNEPKRLPELRIQNLPVNLHLQLTNIAQYYGDNVSAYWRRELRKLADTYPDHIKNAK